MALRSISYNHLELLILYEFEGKVKRNEIERKYKDDCHIRDIKPYLKCTQSKRKRRFPEWTRHLSLLDTATKK